MQFFDCIYKLCMNLVDAKIGKIYKIKSVKVAGKKINLRLRELGLFEGANVVVHKFSPLKKTILVQIFNSLFAMKTDVAKSIFLND